MREEFHGDYPNGTGEYKKLYGWGTINANVWLPSLIELVGIDPSNYADGLGTYYSAMRGLNTSTDWFTDAQGGTQFAYFKQYNASGGGTKLFDACNQQVTWLRSPSCGHTTYTWQITNSQRFDWVLPAASFAVHPAMEHISRQILFIFFMHNAYFYRFIILFIAKNIHIYYNK